MLCPDSCIIMKSDKEVHREMTFFVLFHFTGMFFEPSSRMKKQHKKVCDRESAGGGKGKTSGSIKIVQSKDAMQT